jgi:hypothetical protein
MMACAVKGVMANAGRQQVLRLPGVPSYQHLTYDALARRPAAPLRWPGPALRPEALPPAARGRAAAH